MRVEDSSTADVLTAPERATAPGDVAQPSRAVVWTALAALGVLCLATAFAVISICVIALTVGDPDSRVRFVTSFTRGVAPVVGTSVLWAAITGFALCVVRRLAAPPMGTLRPAWTWTAVTGLALLVVWNSIIVSPLLGFLTDDAARAIRVWWLPTLVAVALLIQSLRLAVKARRTGASRRAVRFLFATAILNSVVLSIVNAACAVIVIYVTRS